MGSDEPQGDDALERSLDPAQPSGSGEARFLGWPTQAPDFCLWYVRLWPCAAEDKSRTAFLAAGATLVLSTLMTMYHTVGGRLLVLFQEPEMPYLMVLVSPSKELATVLIFSYGGASRPHPVPFPGCHSIPEEPLGGYVPLSITGVISQES